MKQSDIDALAKLLDLRHSGLSASKIAELLNLPGPENTKKSAVLGAFQVLKLAGVEIGDGCKVGSRGPDKAPRAVKPKGRVLAKLEWYDREDGVL